MELEKSIISVAGVYQKARTDPLPELPGIYAFWWLAERKELLGANTKIILKGPGGVPAHVEYKDWWPKKLMYPCLYVGKTTNLKNRFSLHIRNGTSGRMHETGHGNEKVKPKTTSCQLRFGIEHVFKEIEQPLELIHKKVGFSYKVIDGVDGVVERFFQEDLLIGTWRPWFNIDSER